MKNAKNQDTVVQNNNEKRLTTRVTSEVKIKGKN